MSQKELPASPDIDQYKKQAKELVRAARAGVPEAVERIGTKGQRDRGTKKTVAPTHSQKARMDGAQHDSARQRGSEAARPHPSDKNKDVARVGHPEENAGPSTRSHGELAQDDGALLRATVKLAEAQLVLAREHGFASWAKFAAEIERRRAERAVSGVSDPVDAFLRAALVPRGTAHVSGTLDEAEAIRARYPEVERANIYTAAVLGDAEMVHAELEGDGNASSQFAVHSSQRSGESAGSHPSDKDKGVARVGHPEATRKGGPYEWEPLLHVCFSRYLRLDKSRAAGFERVTRMLLEAGADANGGWWEVPDYEGGKPVWESALYGAAGLAQDAGVTRLLLEFGADPNDGETPYHAPEGYDNTVVELLLKSGRLSERSKAWMLARKADWHDYDGMQMCLEHGADPNDVPHWGNSALQHAVLRDNGIEMLRMLLEYGGDALLANGKDGRNAAQMAARRGRGDFLRLLEQRGVDPRFVGVDRLIAACARGDRVALAAWPSAFSHFSRDKIASTQDELLAQGGELLGAFAGVGNTEGVRCLLDLGVRADALFGGDAYFDEARDSTALHVAAWRGWPETARLLIERGAPVDAKDGKGRTALQLAVRACTDSYWKRRRTPEWIAVLLEAGASMEGIEVTTGYAEGDAVLRKRVSESAS